MSAISDDHMRENTLLLVGDHNWRKGPKWKAALAWAFGKRDRFVTHLGDEAVVAWMWGKPYLVSLDGARK